MTINDYIVNTKYNCKINKKGKQIFDIIYKFSVIPYSKKIGIIDIPELIFIDSIGFISEYVDFDDKTYIILGSDIITNFAKYNYIYYNNKSDSEIKSLFYKSISRKLLSLNELNYSLFFAKKHVENKWDINKNIKEDISNFDLLLKTFIIQTSLIIHHEYTHFLIQKKLWHTEKFEIDIKNLVSNFLLDKNLIEEFEYLYERILIYGDFFGNTFKNFSSEDIETFLTKAKDYYLNSKSLIQETICDVNSIIMTEHLLASIDKDKNRKDNFEKMILTIKNIELSSHINHYSRKIGKNKVDNVYDFVIQSLFRYFYIRSFFKNEFNFKFENIEKKYDERILNKFLPLLLDINDNQKHIKYWTEEWHYTTKEINDLLK